MPHQLCRTTLSTDIDLRDTSYQSSSEWSQTGKT
ncbi:unnamed protein product [Brassica rapa subsp. trilocularis]